MRSGSAFDGLSTYPFDAQRRFTGSALTAAHFCQTATKVSKKAWLPRTAFAALWCPHSGPAPWARRNGPSMAHHGSPGIHAGRPTARNLHSASRSRKADQDQQPDQKPEPRRAQTSQRLQGPSQQAERRCCCGGRPAWMPGELRRASLGELGRMVGQGPFGSFWGCLPKGTRCKSETDMSVTRLKWICT